MSTSIAALVAVSACAPLPGPEALEPLPVTSSATASTAPERERERELVVVAPPTSARTSPPHGASQELGAVLGLAEGWGRPRAIQGSVRTGNDTARGSAGLTFTGWADGASGASLVSVNLDDALQALSGDPTLSPSSRAEAQQLLGVPFEVLSIGPLTWLRWPGLHRHPVGGAGWVETNPQRAEGVTGELGFGSSVVRPLWLLGVLSPAAVEIEDLGAADGGEAGTGRHLRLTVDLVAGLAHVAPTDRIAVLSEVGPGDVLALEVWVDDAGSLRRFGYERYGDGDLGTPPTGAAAAVVVDLVDAVDMPALAPPAGAVPIDAVLAPPPAEQGQPPTR